MQLFRTLAVLLLVPGLGACRDTVVQPSALLVTQETRGSVFLEARLPSPLSVASTTPLESELQESLETWLDSWGRASEVGSDDRARVYDRVTPPLALEIGRDGVASTLSTLGQALASTDALSEAKAEVPAEARLALDRAREYYRLGLDALDRGRPAPALRAVFLGADEIRTVGPEAVARSLVLRAEGALELARLAFEGREPPEALSRGERLTLGASHALDEGDWDRALQRAFYACQLLGGC